MRGRSALISETAVRVRGQRWCCGWKQASGGGWERSVLGSVKCVMRGGGRRSSRKRMHESANSAGAGSGNKQVVGSGSDRRHLGNDCTSQRSALAQRMETSGSDRRSAQGLQMRVVWCEGAVSAHLGIDCTRQRSALEQRMEASKWRGWKRSSLGSVHCK